MIATVFHGIVNRMINGYLLRDVINKVNGIHFTSTDEIHTLGHLYESMLKEMRDAAGDSGEFYTPRAGRPVHGRGDRSRGSARPCSTRPAAPAASWSRPSSTCEKQCKTCRGPRNVLQDESILGGEAKPLPYLLCQMNLLLHGLEYPEIDPRNSLRFPLTRNRRQGPGGHHPDQSALRRRGGARHSGQLPRGQADRRDRAAVPAAHHAQAPPARRAPRRLHGRRGRGVVVPNGTLFGDGVCARIKEELLKEFNLHTIVRLPNGVFAPYTGIPTNLLFFDRSGPTKEIWYYEQPLPEGRKNYTKTQPIQFEEFADCLAWWKKRKENDRAWKVPAAEILDNNCNLDIKNPRRRKDFEHLAPEQLADDILKKEQRITEIMGEIKELLKGGA